MSYNVYHTNGALLTTVNDGSLNTVTSMNLIGIGYNAYAEVVAENFVKLLENFAGNVSPLSPLPGQLWWDSANKHLNVYDGNQFKSISPTTIGSTSPTGAVNGDFWFDTVNLQLKVYIGPSWVPVTPIYSAAQGISGPKIGSVTDNYGNNHTVTTMYNANNIVAIFSTDSSFTPLTLPGIWNDGINPGITLGYGYSLTAPLVYGDTVSANTFTANVIGNASTSFTGGTFTVSGNINPSSNLSANIGGVNSNYFNYIYGVNFVGTSTTAKYADLAEMYHADAHYDAGTVMVFGGDLDVTVSEKSHDTAVAGIVSTNPAYLMNDNFESDNWLPIALTGRVPCKVRGPVSKGTVLVNSDEFGVACAIDESKYKPGCVVGKSLEDVGDNIVKTIEVSVGRF